ncbi:MAG: hypothetical protein LC789_14495 [Actinobacteria bacterium]|nr:hypothetical protein [Actinomycetota bacterium]MCA1721316.1 hypothetical protein [Actinomycetota bacterium]
MQIPQPQDEAPDERVDWEYAVRCGGTVGCAAGDNPLLSVVAAAQDDVAAFVVWRPEGTDEPWQGPGADGHDGAA